MPNPQELELAAAQLMPHISAIREFNPSPVVLIDGRAGSGKSTLAKLLEDKAFKAFHQAPHVIHMDDLYPGWEGLGAGSLYLVHSILQPLKSQGTADWQIWDWAKAARGGEDPGNGWRSFSGRNLLIVEGCGSVSRQSAGLADLRIWVEADVEVRKARFTERDGGQHSDYWGIWSAQEDEFYSTERSKDLCEMVVKN